MPNITMQFPYPINQSCQEGDILYYTDVNPNTIGGFSVSNGGENATTVTMGLVMSITNVDNNGDGEFDVTNIVCNMDDDAVLPSPTDFIFFGKPRTVNEASIVGYYGEFTFRNNSKEKAELFAVGSEVSQSSK